MMNYIQVLENELSVSQTCPTCSHVSYFETTKLERLEEFKQLLLDGETNTIRLFEKAKRLDLNKEAPLMLVMFLFDANFFKRLEKYSYLLRYFTSHDRSSEPYLIGGLELLIAKYESELLPRASQIIKSLYYENILSPKGICRWSEKKSSKFIDDSLLEKIHQKCARILEWFAEDSDDSDECDCC